MHEKTRILALTACVAVVLSSLGGCKKDSKSQSGTASNGNGGNVSLTFFNTSAEVNTQFSDLFKTYHESHPNVTITLIPTPIGGQ
jgi:raffinose/stachyose/melibiose transport system substrate-binding protein